MLFSHKALEKYYWQTSIRTLHFDVKQKCVFDRYWKPTEMKKAYSKRHIKLFIVLYTLTGVWLQLTALCKQSKYETASKMRSIKNR